jgi:uncharacterized protein YjdB
MASSITLKVNQSISFTSTISDAYGVSASAKNINYVSSNPSVVILANSGTFVAGSIPQNSVSNNVLTGVSNGSATITITIDGGAVIDTISVVVESLPPAELTIVFGTPTPA